MGSSAAFVKVPEASVYEDGFSLRLEYQVWLSREIGNVKAIAKPKAEDNPPNKQFRRCILPSDTPHCFTALLNGNAIHRPLW